MINTRAPDGANKGTLMHGLISIELIFSFKLTRSILGGADGLSLTSAINGVYNTFFALTKSFVLQTLPCIANYFR